MPNCKCVVAGCKSGYESDRKRRKLEGIKNPSLFSVPSDPDVFKKWSSVIPLKNNVLKFKDKVCEEHFKESDIERQNKIGFSTGETYVVNRKRVILKPDAVPSIFNNSLSYLSYKSKKIKSPLRHSEDLDSQKNNSEDEDSIVTDLKSEIEIKNEKESFAGEKCISERNKVLLKPVSKIIIYSPNCQDNEFIKRKAPVECTENLDDLGELVVPDIDKKEIEKKIAKEFSTSVKHIFEKEKVIIKTNAVPSTFRNLLNYQVNELKKRKTPVECIKNVHPEKVKLKNIQELVPNIHKSDIMRKNVEEYCRGEKNTYERKFVPIKPKPVSTAFINSPNSQDNELVPDIHESDIKRKNVEKYSKGEKNTYERNFVLIKPKPVSTAFINSPNSQDNELVPDIHESDIKRKNEEKYSKGEKNTYERNFVLIKPKPVPSALINSTNSQDNKSTNRLSHEDNIQDLIPQQIKLENVEKYVVHKIDNLFESNTDFNFSFLVENIDKVIKPTNRWGFTCHEDFIVCVYWNRKFEAEKRIIFNSELEIRVFLLDNEINEVFTVGSLADVSKLIRCIADYVICAGYKKGKDDCKIYMQRNYRGRPRTYCEVCVTEQKKQLQLNYYAGQKKLLGNVIERSKKSAFRSKLHLYQRIACENRKNALLRNKVQALQRQLKKQKYLEQSKSF